MADSKLSALTACTTPVEGDMFLVSVLADLTKSFKVTWANIKLALGITDGWTPANETWTYVSATSFTVSGDKTTKYNIGDKFKATMNSVVKYGYIVAASYSSGTGLTTVTTQGDSLTNYTISANYYSKFSTPNGFPNYFAWNGASGSNAQGFSSVATDSNMYRIDGRILTIRINISGTSNATSFTLTAPVAPSVGFYQFIRALDNTSTRSIGLCSATAGSATLTLYTSVSGGAWTNTGTKACETALITYII